MRLVWQEEAADDLDGILEYIRDRSPAAADKLEQAVFACVSQLPAHSYLYRSGRIPGTREAVVHPNYIIVYRMTPNAVEIAAVIHARQRYP